MFSRQDIHTGALIAVAQTRSILEVSTLVFAFDIAALGASMSFSAASPETSKFAWYALILVLQIFLCHV